MGNCRDRPPKYIICSDPHKIEEHYYGVTSCTKRKRKIYAYITTKCTSCRNNYPANLLHYLSKYRAYVKARQKKKTQEKKG